MANSISWTFSGFIRSSLFSLVQITTTVFYALTGLLLFALPFRIRYAYITSWSHLMIWWAKVCCGIHYEIHGREHILSQNAIVLSKHQSAWETLFYQTLLGPQSWVLKKELLRIPFFGWGLALLEPIAIDRQKKSSINQLLIQGTKRLRQGRWVIIFPEGTRVAVGAVGKYSKSGALLAKETSYPIIPIAHNAGVFWPRHSFLKKAGTIQVVIGPPIYPEKLSIDEIHQQAKDWIEQTMKNLPTE